MEEIIAQFPDRIKVKEEYKSFLFQPERVSLNSRQSILNLDFLDVAGGYEGQNINAPNDVYYQFRCDLKTPLLRVRSLELLRASIPNAVPSIPNDELFFFYYRVDMTGGLVPDYEQFTPENIYCVYLYPTGFLTSPSWYVNEANYGWNTAFSDYDSLVDALNNACQNNSLRLNETQTRFIPGDISFSYDPVLNKIKMKGNNVFDEGGNPQYFYSPVGWRDTNLNNFVIPELLNNFADTDNADELGRIPIEINSDGYTLNRRLGFTFNGQNVDDPFVSFAKIAQLRTRIIPQGNNDIPWTPATANEYYTAENFCDLVHTGNVFLYADIAGGSTQDTNIDDRLLAVIPANASSLGVTFGESKISCELTKTSDNIYSIIFTMRTDKGTPYWLPTNAYVNLELKVRYN